MIEVRNRYFRLSRSFLGAPVYNSVHIIRLVILIANVLCHLVNLTTKTARENPNIIGIVILGIMDRILSIFVRVIPSEFMRAPGWGVTGWLSRKLMENANSASSHDLVEELLSGKRMFKNEIKDDR